MYLIGEASARSGVHIETIRYYERVGVVPEPGRSPAGRRLYTKDEIAKLRFVRRCRDLGFPITIIQTFLSLRDEDDRSCGEVKSLAEDHLAQIGAKIESLTRLQEALRRLSDTCEAEEPHCQMLDALLNDGLEEAGLH